MEYRYTILLAPVGYLLFFDYPNFMACMVFNSFLFFQLMFVCGAWKNHIYIPKLIIAF